MTNAELAILGLIVEKPRHAGVAEDEGILVGAPEVDPRIREHEVEDAADPAHRIVDDQGDARAQIAGDDLPHLALDGLHLRDFNDQLVSHGRCG